MVGGKVVSTISRASGITEVLVRGTGCERNNTAKVFTNDTHLLQPGASIWWQAHRMFTRNPGARSEVCMSRIRG